MPPETVKTIFPFAVPGMQVGISDKLIIELIRGIKMEPVCMQPTASVTVTVYVVPPLNPVAFAVVCAGTVLHE